MGTRIKKSRKFWSFINVYKEHGRDGLYRYSRNRLESELKRAKQTLSLDNFRGKENAKLISTVEDEIAYRILLDEK